VSRRLRSWLLVGMSIGAALVVIGGAGAAVLATSASTHRTSSRDVIAPSDPVADETLANAGPAFLSCDSTDVCTPVTQESALADLRMGATIYGRTVYADLTQAQHEGVAPVFAAGDFLCPLASGSVPVACTEATDASIPATTTRIAVYSVVHTAMEGGTMVEVVDGPTEVARTP